ncbi:ELMO domain-containing protein 3-like isoform X3 [Varroa jacobsoni]|uniref:ELMO domain-containing protein n=1 Tax=Varroa destructor TaxID=109461 RepID=A0A7M7JN29_VARDE|nr:ELMO domain-containing protein 3-like isoform X2 [Varroa destructor]XP_022711100.1 ELMO domain-containing protein 3-like isoform X3 [Varroa jacobsoni]
MMVAVISMETLMEETEEELAAEQFVPSSQSPGDADGYEARLAAALEEWESVGVKEIEISTYEDRSPLSIVHCSRILTYEEAADIIIDAVNISDYRVPFNTECQSHGQMVQTIYRKLTGNTYDCPRYGAHWETIGFQGNDPATDLRGCGILGLLQLLYLATHQDNETVTKDIYRISLHATQNFPFAVMGINMTKIVLESLREDCLNRICNERQGVLPVLNDFYVGTYLIMFLSWTKHAATVYDTGYIMQEVAKFAKGSPLKVLHNLQHYRNNGVHSHFCDEHFTSLAA